jgi:hypothetical protein
VEFSLKNSHKAEMAGRGPRSHGGGLGGKTTSL